jgi:iron(III) transport system permease protein
LDTTLLVYPPGIETLPVSIFSLLHYGANESVAAICLIQMLTIALLFSFFLKNFELKILI